MTTMSGSGAERERARTDVLDACRWMRAEHLVPFTAGNVSVRVAGEPGIFAVTPTALPYDSLEQDDIAIVATTGAVLDGRHPPTSELPLHTLVYARRPEVGAIVHTHSPAAMAMAALGLTLPAFLTGLVDATGGAVTTAPYARPGTAAMADAVEAALLDRGACFLRHHGLLAIGADIGRAYRAAAVTESAADAYLRALALGPVPEPSPEEVDWIAEGWRAQWSGGTVTTRG